MTKLLGLHTQLRNKMLTLEKGEPFLYNGGFIIHLIIFKLSISNNLFPKSNTKIKINVVLCKFFIFYGKNLVSSLSLQPEKLFPRKNRFTINFFLYPNNTKYYLDSRYFSQIFLFSNVIYHEQYFSRNHISRTFRPNVIFTKWYISRLIHFPNNKSPHLVTTVNSDSTRKQGEARSYIFKFLIRLVNEFHTILV